MGRAFSWGGARPRRRGEPKINEEGRATAARPASRFLCQGPPLRSFTKEMGQDLKARSAKAGPPAAAGSRRVTSRFLRGQLRRIGPGHPLRARPRNGPSLSTADAVPEPELQPGPPLRTQRPRSPQACQRGASPGRILLSLGGLLIAAAESTPPPRSRMSPLGARPLADRFQTTTRRKSPARSVTFLRDPTIPVSVTLLNDLTGRKTRPAIHQPSGWPAFCWSSHFLSGAK